MDGGVAAGLAPNGPRNPHVAGFGSERVVLALAVGLPDGVDRRQVNDVEAHVGDAGEVLGRGLEGPVRSAAAGGAREELVPRPESSPLAIYGQLENGRVRGGATSIRVGEDELVQRAVDGP